MHFYALDVDLLRQRCTSAMILTVIVQDRDLTVSVAMIIKFVEGSSVSIDKTINEILDKVTKIKEKTAYLDNRA
jgi:hypothetical protein